MKKTIITTEKPVSVSSPKQLIEFAKQLKQFIVQQELFTNIKGKNYVNVEGWEYAGASTGILPIVTALEFVVSIGDEVKYQANVDLIRLSDNQKVGAGVAFCSSKEKNFIGKDEYVIASMAQTRAIGKAYRNMFAWLMKIAGYEATPAEEVAEEKEKKIELAPDMDIKKATPAQIKTITALDGTPKPEMTQLEASQLIRELATKKGSKNE